mmetsp:Transcript_2923/g.6388  ORF Transcript_2923/g.6388 Transcript_2923/m.6388 type:complete len:155 (-) Transcript_2923:213-677(-)
MSVLADARAEVRQARDVLGAKEDCQRVCHAFGREDVPVRYRDVPSVVEGHRPPDGVVLPPMSQAPPSGAQHRIALALALLGLIANLYCLDVLRFQFVRHLQRRRGGQYGSGAGIDVLQYIMSRAIVRRVPAAASGRTISRAEGIRSEKMVGEMV